MGTIVQDANAPSLLDAATTTTSGNQTAQRAAFVGFAQFELDITAVSGTSPTLDVTVESAWNSAFTQGKVQLGTFGQQTVANTVAIDAYVDAPYVRAVATVSGTSPVFTATLKVREPHLNRVTGGPGMPTGPGTGTGFPDSARSQSATGVPSGAPL